MKLELTKLEAEWLYAILKDCKPTALKDSGNKYIVAQLVIDKMDERNKRDITYQQYLDQKLEQEMQ